MKTEIIKTVIESALNSKRDILSSFEDVQCCCKEELIVGFKLTEKEADDYVNSSEFEELLDVTAEELGII